MSKRNIKWAPEAWEDYLHWSSENPKHKQRIEEFIEQIQRTPFQGTGKPEPLKGNLTGYWSRRIDSEHRLIYKVDTNDIVIIQARYHY